MPLTSVRFVSVSSNMPSIADCSINQKLQHAAERQRRRRDIQQRAADFKVAERAAHETESAELASFQDDFDALLGRYLDEHPALQEHIGADVAARLRELYDLPDVCHVALLGRYLDEHPALQEHIGAVEKAVYRQLPVTLMRFAMEPIFSAAWQRDPGANLEP
jgi:hypothetical protein